MAHVSTLLLTSLSFTASVWAHQVRCLSNHLLLVKLIVFESVRARRRPHHFIGIVGHAIAITLSTLLRWFGIGALLLQWLNDAQ